MPPFIDLDAIEYLTFDCYGTLIDWESGIATALGPVCDAHGTPLNREALLELYAEIEPEVESRPPFRPYRQILADVMDEVGRRLGWEPTPDERTCLADTLPDWAPFDDVREALSRLKERFQLAVISNVDDELFAGSAERLGNRFDAVVTALQARAYKPDPQVFEFALERLGVTPDRLIHVAQSLFHDVGPARALGIRTVWVNRRAGQTGSGATPASEVVPDLQVRDLAELIEKLDL
jgi:2-haloacid dehalogenase